MEKKIRKVLVLFIFTLFLFVPSISQAAVLGFTPSTLTREAGSIFTTTVYVSSVERALNAVSGVVSFPTDRLEVVSISKSNSIMSLWVTEPSFSNADGTISFEGIALNPGFQGAEASVISVTFRAKKIGNAPVTFSSASILANDGSGTNILSRMLDAAFSIVDSTPVATPLVVPTNGSLSVINSSSHPDQAKWYSDNTPTFSWILPRGALEVKTAIGKSPVLTPLVSYVPPITQKTVDELADGTYYFALQIRTESGWGEISRYRVNIDTTPPFPFQITFPHGLKGWEPQPVILFNTTDNESGIFRYDVKIGDGGPEKIAATANSNPYPLPPQTPGTYTVTVTASDEAGNTTNASQDFTIESIESPKITQFKEENEYGDIIKIRGTTYPNSDIVVTFTDEDQQSFTENTKSNSLGDWAVVAAKRFSPGVYSFTARVIDARGAQSYETVPKRIAVKSEFLAEIIDLVLNYLSAAILIILALGAIAASIFFTLHKSSKAIRRMKKGSHDVERVLEKSFDLLIKDLDEHITRFKSAGTKRKLSKEEIEFLEHFEDELEEAKEVVSKTVHEKGSE